MRCTFSGGTTSNFGGFAMCWTEDQVAKVNKQGNMERSARFDRQ